MRKMFTDEKLQKQFDEKGYVIIPLLNQDEVAEMTTFYQNQNQRLDNYDDTYAEFSVLNAENESRKKIFEQITSVLLPKTKSILNDCQPIIANYVCKEPGKGFVPVHQNWAVVDETKYASVSVWCPLVDVNEVNGTLAFVNGSHKHFRGPRGSYANRNFMNIDDLIVNRYLTYVNVKAGEAIILDDSVVHYSSINHSDKMRLAVQLIMLPAEATPYHYTFREENGKTISDLYEVDVAYYLGMKNWVGDLSSYKRIRTFEYKNELYSEKEFKQRMHSERKNIFSKVYELIAG